MSCSDECSSDSDCSGDNKCCYNGCSYSCLKAVKDPGGLDEETKDDQVPIGNANGWSINDVTHFLPLPPLLSPILLNRLMEYVTKPFGRSPWS